MSTSPQCILIDPASRSVSRRDLPSGLAAMQALVGSNCITIGLRLTNGDFLYVDEEALLRQPAPATFTVEGCTLLGNAVVVRVDPNTGIDCPPSSELAALAEAVSFSPL